LHATGGHSCTIFARVSGQDSAKPPVFCQDAATLPKQLFELKNEETIKKSGRQHPVEEILNLFYPGSGMEKF
jgi:hypothetical protein